MDRFFGDIYPFIENRKCEFDIKTTTQVELVKLSKPKLIRLCNKFRNIEFGILELFKMRRNSEEKGIPKFLRKAKRYHVPIDMNLEMYPQASENSTIIIDGFSSDKPLSSVFNLRKCHPACAGCCLCLPIACSGKANSRLDISS